MAPAIVASELESSESDSCAGLALKREPAVDMAPASQCRWRTTCDWLARRPLVVLAAALVIWGLTDVRSRGQVDPANPGVHRTDFTVYTEAGAAFFDGRDPYAVTNPRGWGYLYPPLFGILVAPLHALDTQLQVVIWFFFSVLLVWGCYRESARLLRLVTAWGDEPAAPLPRWLSIAAIATVAFPALNCLQRGQVGVVKVYLLLAGFRLLLESRSWRKAFAAGCVFAAAIALKITPALPIGLLAIDKIAAALRARPWGRLPRHEWRARRGLAQERACGISLGIVAGLVICFLVVPAALIGAERNAQSLGRWWDLVAMKASDTGYDLFAGNSYSLQNQSLLNATRHFGNWVAYEFSGGSHDRARVNAGEPLHVMDAPLVGRLLLAVRLAIVVLAGWLTWQSGLRRDRLTITAAFALACVATLVVSPISRAHYFVLLLPAALFVPLWFERAGQARLARVLAWVPVALVVSHYLAVSWVGRVGMLGIGTAGWFTVSAVAMIVIERRTAAGSEHPVIHAFRVRAAALEVPAAAPLPGALRAPGALQIDDRAVARGGLGPLVPDLVHHEREG
jgi:hypothetical protein